MYNLSDQITCNKRTSICEFGNLPCILIYACVFRFAPETCRDSAGLSALDSGALRSLFQPCFRFDIQWALPAFHQIGRRVIGALCQPLSVFVLRNAT